MKCDFCEKQAAGYVSMQAAIYCDDHREKAEEIEAAMWAECEASEKPQEPGDECPCGSVSYLGCSVSGCPLYLKSQEAGDE